MYRIPVGPGLERDQARFWSFVRLPNSDGCMLWSGSTDGRYGSFWLVGRKVKAHIYSYVTSYDLVPDGMVVDHVRDKGCASKRCVAPAHLEAVTQGENLLRGRHFQRSKTHCSHGHEYSEENTQIYITKEGWRNRRCRICRGGRCIDCQGS